MRLHRSRLGIKLTKCLDTCNTISTGCFFGHIICCQFATGIARLYTHFNYSFYASVSDFQRRLFFDLLLLVFATPPYYSHPDHLELLHPPTRPISSSLFDTITGISLCDLLKSLFVHVFLLYTRFFDFIGSLPTALWHRWDGTWDAWTDTRRA